MTALFLFLGGLVGLLLAGHLLIVGATRIGERLGMGPSVIGLTLVAAGTSAPELAVFYQAVQADDTALAVGSIIGSNIANVLLVLGLIATLGAVQVSPHTVRVDIPVMATASVGLLVLASDGTLSRTDGIVLLVPLALYIWWMLRTRANTPTPSVTKGPKQGGPRLPATQRSGLPVALGGIAVGVIGLVFAAGFVVDGAEQIAVAVGVPELIVGLTIVALGTSAPEITTSLLAAIRGDRNLAVGNALGSNIFNILLVLGLSGALSPNGIAFGDDAVRLDLPILVAAAIACVPIVFGDHILDRWEGLLFVAFYVIYLGFLALDGTDRLVTDPLTIVLAVFVIPLGLISLGVAIAKVRKSRHRVAQDGVAAPAQSAQLPDG